MEKKNNGKTSNNGYHQKRNIFFQNLKIRADIAEAFKDNAFRNGKNQSDYLDELMKSEYMEQLFERSDLAPALANILKYIEKRAREPAIEKRIYEP